MATPTASSAQAPAWQRWEMRSLRGAAHHPGTSAAAAVTAAPARPAGQAAEALALRQLREQAQAAGAAEGRREGWAAGHADGYREGLAAGLAAASARAEELLALSRSLPEALRRADTQVADALLALAMDVARVVVHRTLREQPQWLLPLVQDLMHSEPALRGEPRLLLHPDDVQLVRDALGTALQTAGWQLRADDSISRGGCRVEAASGEIDARLETRWARAVEALDRLRPSLPAA